MWIRVVATLNVSIFHLHLQAATSILTWFFITATHHNVSTVTKAFSVVVRSNNFKLKVGPAHVAKHHGGLDDARVDLDDKAVLALSCRWDDQAVRHRTVVPCVLVSGLEHTNGKKNPTNTGVIHGGGSIPC